MAQYIDKDALVAWLKERIRDYWSDSENTMGIFPYALEEVIKYVDTLEVKEIDYETKSGDTERIFPERKDGNEKIKKEINEYFKTAKYFIELGLEVQKGE